jgi:hypothetical protein
MNCQFRFGGLVIKREGVRHPILPDIRRSSRLKLSQKSYHVNISKSCLHHNQILKFKWLLSSLHVKLMLKLFKHGIQ